MDLIFFGSPDFAIPALKQLVKRHNVLAVVTGPDRPAGRGRNVRPTAVKMVAEKAELPVLQPESFTDTDFLKQLEAYKADVYVVVAFKILPPEVFEIPPVGTINLHASLLPRYRGAAPIQWALINGEKKSGVTTFFINQRVDTGDILLQKSCVIPENMIAAELHDVLAHLGADALVETLDALENNIIVPQPQQGKASKAPKISRELGALNWSESAESIHHLIRGLSPYPGAFSYLDDKYIKFIRSKVIDPEAPANGNGQLVVKASPDRLLVKTGRGLLEILTLQPAGKKQMRADEFLRGYHLPPDARFQQKHAE